MDYIVQAVEGITGKLQQLGKADLIEILKQYALYDDKVRSDLQLRLSPPDEVLEAAKQRIRASFDSSANTYSSSPTRTEINSWWSNTTLVPSSALIKQRAVDNDVISGSKMGTCDDITNTNS